MSDEVCQELTIVQAKVNVEPPVLNLKAPETGLNPTENNVIAAIANWVLPEVTEYELSWSSISKAGKHLEVYAQKQIVLSSSIKTHHLQSNISLLS